MGKLFSLDPKVQNLCPLYVSQKSERGIKNSKRIRTKSCRKHSKFKSKAKLLIWQFGSSYKVKGKSKVKKIQKEKKVGTTSRWRKFLFFSPRKVRVGYEIIVDDHHIIFLWDILYLFF